MNAILLTVFCGFLLVSLFVVLFMRYRRDAPSSSPERDSLLPLEDEHVRPARRQVSKSSADKSPRPPTAAAPPR